MPFNKSIFIALIASTMLLSCQQQNKNNMKNTTEFEYLAEQFADVKIMRYQVPGFDSLDLEKKKLIYYLSEAARCGRDIYFDQLGKHNLFVRATLENIYKTYPGDRQTESFKAFHDYLKRVWFSSGIHHHYSRNKFKPEFTPDYFNELVSQSDSTGFPIAKGQDLEEMKNFMEKVLFDEGFLPKSKSQDTEKDLLLHSSVNFYENVTEKEALEYYKEIRNNNDPKLSYGLNSKLLKENGKLVEKTYKMDGLYGPAIEKIVYWLEKALDVTENQQQRDVMEKLIAFYKTGNLETWDEYNVLWVNDTASLVDYVNGFIEVYDDPLGIKGYWEAIANFKDIEATKRTEKLSKNALWFEQNSPVADKYKKEDVTGITAKVITVAQLGGACYPSTPIGINLPNADWIRKNHGSKSVTIANITHAYNQVGLTSGVLEEFLLTKEEIEKSRKYSPITGDLHTDMHECLGHGSGQVMEGVTSDDLRSYYSVIEETRADLYALYFMADSKLVELGLLPNLEAAESMYAGYIRNGLMLQLRRIEPGEDIQQAHLRNRQLISKWCYEKGQPDGVISLVKNNGKTYVQVNDYKQLRQLFGKLLTEVQRIRSEGDYQAAQNLVETYAVKVDTALHQEVLERYKKLNIAPYGGFLNPEFVVSTNKDGEITDIKLDYNTQYTEQMLKYSEKYSYLDNGTTFY